MRTFPLNIHDQLLPLNRTSTVAQVFEICAPDALRNSRRVTATTADPKVRTYLGVGAHAVSAGAKPPTLINGFIKKPLSRTLIDGGRSHLGSRGPGCGSDSLMARQTPLCKETRHRG